jgi:pimeloyl-ACP methyl ester carboxylesterase
MEPADLGIKLGDGVGLRLREWAGDGVPFLLVHGLASNARLWDGVAAVLSDAGHRVVTVDLRGHGQSDKPDTGYDVANVAADLVGVIEHRELARPVVAGQSWGGNVVLELAARRPGDVRGIACVDGGWIELADRFESWDACLAALTPPPLAGLPLEDVERMFRSRHPDWPETGIAGALASFEVRRDGTVAPWLTLDHHVAALAGLWEHRPSTRYADVKVPVLLLPADDGSSRRAEAAVDRAAATLPVSSTVWFRADHDVHAQRPAEVATVLRAALDDGFFA